MTEEPRLLGGRYQLGPVIGRGGMAANTIRIKPPYCIDKNDVAAILKALDESFTIIEKS